MSDVREELLAVAYKLAAPKDSNWKERAELLTTDILRVIKGHTERTSARVVRGHVERGWFYNLDKAVTKALDSVEEV